MKNSAALKINAPQLTTVVEKKRISKPLITVADFELWQSKRTLEYNYEFYHGKIIRKEPMKQNELIIYQILLEFFLKTKAFANRGLLFAEADAPIDDFRKRIPDISFYTRAQVLEAQKIGNKVTTTFAIEILSDSETTVHIETKIQDYFDAGVLVVWYIHPKTQKIHVYTSPNDVKIYHGDMIVNAKPALDDFEFPVKALFETN